MIHEEFIDAIKHVISVSLPEVELTPSLKGKIDEALRDFEDTHNVKLMLVDEYDVRQQFQKMRNKCSDIFSNQMADAIARSLYSVQEEFSAQLDILEESLSSELLGNE